MHKVEIPSWAVERALARRGRLHPFDDLDPARTALVVVDLQNGFMAPGQPAEIAQAREIVPNVNRLARVARAAGGTVVWIQNTITPETEKSWSVWFGHFAREDWGPRMRQAFNLGDFGHDLYPDLDVAEADLKVRKARFSALIQGSSDLAAILRARGIDTLIVVGTATNVCCESTARDAMMLNYKVFFVSDANACRTDAEHNATLASLMVMFADVRSTGEMIPCCRSARRRPPQRIECHGRQHRRPLRRRDRIARLTAVARSGGGFARGLRGTARRGRSGQRRLSV
jgi:ureidoacrylate peracid hydrolase